MLNTTSLRKRLFAAARARRLPAPARPAALPRRLEELEDRSVPATIVTVPYQQADPSIPHPGYEGATTTLKAIVRDASGHTVRVTWDVNLNGSFADDSARDYVGTQQYHDVGRTFTVPAGTANSTLPIAVQAVDQQTGQTSYGTYTIQVSALTPRFGPRAFPQTGYYPEFWTPAERELVRDMTTDETLWNLHRQVITMGEGTRSISGYIPTSSSIDAPTPLALELYARTGHLPAYPPGTMITYGGNSPVGNDSRWASDPYAETSLRLANYLATELYSSAVPSAAEQNDGRTPIAGTDDSRAYLTSSSLQFGDAGQVGFQSQTVSAFAALLPALGGTAVQVGVGMGHSWEFLTQQMVDGLSYAQAKSGTADGGWWYNLFPDSSYANLEATAYAVRALAAAEAGGFGVIVNQDTKYRVPNILYSARQANGSVPRFWAPGHPTTGSFTYTAGALLGYRWLGAQNFSPGDTTTLAPYSAHTRGQLRTAYDQALTYVGDGWLGSAYDPGYGWTDHFWRYPAARFDGVPTTTTATGANGYSFAMFLHAAAYRTNEPDLAAVPTTAGGSNDWPRDFESYLSTSQRRNAADYGTFGSVAEQWVEYASMSAMYFGAAGRTALAGLTLAPDPGPVAAASAGPPTAFVGDPIAFDGSASWHVLPNRTVAGYEWDFDAANGVFPGTADATGVSATHAYTRPGTYTATLRVRDDATPPLADTATVAVTVLNHAPSAHPGGPYLIHPGGALSLDATGSSDPDVPYGDTLTFDWDLDLDGQYDDATGATPTVSWATLQSLGYGLGTFVVRVRVTDTYGYGVTYALSSALVSVTDGTPPTITGTTPSMAGGVLPAGATSLGVTFSEAVTGASAATSYDLRSQGADGLLGTADDPVVTLTPTYSGTTATLVFPALSAGVYRLMVTDGITDLAGNQLDGDGNGTAGGNWVRDVVVGANTTTLTSPNGYAFDTAFGGFGAGQLVQGTNNAFDGLNRLQVGGSDYAPAVPTSPWVTAARVTGTPQGWVQLSSYATVSNLTLSFVSDGSPIRFQSAINVGAYPGEHGWAEFRFAIDGVGRPSVGSQYFGGDYEHDMLNLEDFVSGLAPGPHVVTLQARTSGPCYFGNYPWDPAAGASLTAYQYHALPGGGPSVTADRVAGTPQGWVSPTYAPVSGLTLSFVSDGSPVRLQSAINVGAYPGENAWAEFRFAIDGVARPSVGGRYYGDAASSAGSFDMLNLEDFVSGLAPGPHVVTLQARTSGPCYFGNYPWDPAAGASLTAYQFHNAPTPTPDDGGRTVVSPAQSLAGLTVSRELTVPAAGAHDFARTVDVFTNPTAAPITTTVTVVGNLGSDAATTVFATQSGNTAVEPDDQWVGTDDADGTGSPAVIHYVHGPVGLVPDSVAVVGDNVVWTYTLTVPAGETVRLASFTILADTRAAAVSAAAALVGGTGFGGEAAAFLTAGELDSLANFQFNHPPVADPLSVTTDEDTSVVVTLTGSDPDGDPLAYTLLTGPAHGSLTGTAPNLTYTPAPDYHGPDSFTFIVNDGRLDSPPATVSVTVNSVDDTPVARPDAGATNEDTVRTVPAVAGLLANDSDADGDPLTIASVNGVAADVGRTITLVSGARLTVDADGGYVYDPRGALDRLATGETLTDGFDYEASDGSGTTGVAHVTIAVTGVNDAPAVSGPVAISVAENTPAGTTLAVYPVTDPDSLASVTLIGPDAAAFELVSLGGGGYALRLLAAPDYETPADADHDGVYAVTVHVADGTDTTDLPVAVTVTNVNEGVFLSGPAAVSVDENTTPVAAYPAADPDRGAVGYTLTGPDAGRFTIDAAGMLGFAAAPDFEHPADAGADNVYLVTVTATDAQGETANRDVAVTVRNVNDNDPVITSDGGGPTAAVAVDENTTAVTTVTATDADGTTAFGYALSGPDAGRFTIDAAGHLAFAAAPDYETGPHAYHVTVTVSDGARTAAQALTVAVNNLNDNAPVAAPDAVVLSEDGSAPTAVLANDADADGDPLTVTAVGPAAHGIATLSGGVLSYAPGPDFFGTDSFSYTVSDGVHTATATVSVTVTEVNDPPVAAADSYRVTRTGTVAFAGLLANDTDPDNADGLPGNEDTLAVGEVNGVTLTGGSLTVATAHGGTVVVAADGSFTYIPAAAFSGVDSFTYRARDSRGGLSPTAATVSLTVSSVTWAYDAGTNTLAVTGRSPDETITLSRDPASGRVRLGGTLDEVTDALSAPGLMIAVDAGAGSDAVSLSALAAADYAASTLCGGPGDTLTGGDRPDAFAVTVGATAGPAAAVGGGAGDTLTILGTAAADAFDVNQTAAGAVVGNGTVVTLTGLTGLTLDGLDGADSYSVATDGLGVSVAIADSGTAGTDAATVSGTSGPDVFDVNTAIANAVLLGGSPRVSYTPALEALTATGLAGGDTFTVTPSRYAAGQATAISVQGDDPTTEPGDTLALRAAGVAAPTLEGTGTGPDLLPSGHLRSAAASPTHAPVGWSGIETLPVPGGLGGSFDFGPAGSPVQAGYTPASPEAMYSAAAGYGWATTPPYGNRAYDAGAGELAGSPLQSLLRDYAYGWSGVENAGVFQVDVAPNRPVQVTAYLGAPGVARDGQVVEWSPDGATWFLLTPAAGVTTLPAETTSAGGVVTPAGGDLYVRFRDVTGEPHWSVAGLDVRPTDPGSATGTGALVAPLLLSRAYSSDGATPQAAASGAAFAAVPADGVSIDYYHGVGAVPNSILTISATGGTVVDAAETAGDHTLATRFLNPDAAGYVRGFQVQADPTGGFTFGIRRPTNSATSTVQVTDTTGFRADRFTQAFTLPTTRRLDFGPLPVAGTADYGNGGTVDVGYTPFGTATYSAATALGWAAGTPAPVAFTPGGTGATAVQADGVYGGYAPSEFVIDVPDGTYVVTATLGDLAARRDDLFVEVLTGAGWVFARGYNPTTNAYDLDLNGLTSPAGVSPNAGQSMVRSFLAGAVGGQLRVRFGNVTGNPYWSLSALDVRPAPAPLTVTRTSAAPTADGTTVSTYTVTGAAAGTVLTVRTALGAPDGTDASTTYDGFQVVVPPSGTTAFSVKAPFSTSVASSSIEVESVTGGERGLFTESYAASPPPPTATPAVRRFDFNGPSNDTNPAMTGVRGNEVWTTGADYGWLTAVGEFERAVSTMPASMTAAQKALFRDGASLGGPAGTFRVKVSDAGADYAVRYYVGDSYKKWPWIRLQVEGGAASGQLATNVNQYWSYVMFGKDADADGYLDVKVFGSATWVLNAIDVAKGTTASVLPPSLFAPSPQAAAFTVTSGTAPKLTPAGLAPVVAEAVNRWTALGADPARLAAVTVSITDLNDAGRLGEHVPGSVHIDDDAGGRGWFVDPTPADDAEFGAAVGTGRGATDGAAAGGVDLLTVVMHEFGHELGLDDVDPAAAPADLMAETLDVGVRRLPVGLALDGKVERPVRPTVTLTAFSTAGADLPALALWLDKVEAVYSPGVAIATADDRVRVAVTSVEPVKVGEVRAAVASTLAATPAWPDADALLGLDGVYVD